MEGIRSNYGQLSGHDRDRLGCLDGYHFESARAGVCPIPHSMTSFDLGTMSPEMHDLMASTASVDTYLAMKWCDDASLRGASLAWDDTFHIGRFEDMSMSMPSFTKHDWSLSAADAFGKSQWSQYGGQLASTSTGLGAIQGFENAVASAAVAPNHGMSNDFLNTPLVQESHDGDSMIYSSLKCMVAALNMHRPYPVHPTIPTDFNMDGIPDLPTPDIFTAGLPDMLMSDQSLFSKWDNNRLAEAYMDDAQKSGMDKTHNASLEAYHRVAEDNDHSTEKKAMAIGRQYCITPMKMSIPC